MIVKNVTYLFALAAGLLTVSGCSGWFCGDKKNNQAVAAESKPLAENEVATEATAVEASTEATTPVASAEGAVEQVATEEKVATETVAAAEAPASAMPMNEVAAAAPAEEKAA